MTCSPKSLFNNTSKYYDFQGHLPQVFDRLPGHHRTQPQPFTPRFPRWRDSKKLIKPSFQKQSRAQRLWTEFSLGSYTPLVLDPLLIHCFKPEKQYHVRGLQNFNRKNSVLCHIPEHSSKSPSTAC